MPPNDVRVRLPLFASYAEALGRSEMALALPAGSSVADVLARPRQDPAAGRLPPSPLVAVNQRYAKPDTLLADGDEVALIPPVAKAGAGYPRPAQLRIYMGMPAFDPIRSDPRFQRLLADASP